jgi:phage gpG-like protein
MFQADVEGEAELAERFAAMPEAIRAALQRKIADLAQRLEEKIKGKLSGAVLQARSGALRDSIEARVEDDVASFISTAKYAAAQEYGFDGEVAVAAHSRTIKEAFGKAVSPKTIFVRAFSRHMDLPERSFMRSALNEMQDEIAAALADAVDEGIGS